MTKPYHRHAFAAAALMAAGLFASPADAQSTITIATVNNGDMVVMQRLSSQFERDNPNIKLR